MKDILRLLHVKPAKMRDHFSFNLFNFHFFKYSEWRNLFFEPVYKCPWLALPPYVLVMEVLLFRRRRCFVSLKNNVVGIFALHERPESLYVSSLAVSPKYRRLGIATFALNYACKLTVKMDKKWLELSVSTMNFPALRLYKKLGFTLKKEGKWSLTMRKKIKSH